MTRKMKGSNRRYTQTKSQYAQTIRPIVAANYKTIYRLAVPYALNWLHQPRSFHPACREDLKAEVNNAKDVATDLFAKWISGDRQDWDGNPENLKMAVGSAINSILSGRFKRYDNVHLTRIEDNQLEWLYSDPADQDDTLSFVDTEDQKRKLKVIEQLFPPVGYAIEILILSTMIGAGIYNSNDVASYLGLTRPELKQALTRIAEHTRTEDFAIRLQKALADFDEIQPLQSQIQTFAEEIVRLRCKPEN